MPPAVQSIASIPTIQITAALETPRIQPTIPDAQSAHLAIPTYKTENEYDYGTIKFAWCSPTLKNGYIEIAKQLERQLEYLSQHADQIDPLLEKINRALQSQRLSQKQTDFSHQNLPPTIPNSFLRVRGEETLASWPKIDENYNHNFKEIFNRTVNTMHICGLKLGLAYHHIYHPMEVTLDTLHFAKELNIPKQWIPLLALCGITHDAYFDGARISDEKKSAELLIGSLQELLPNLSNDEKKLLENLVSVLIVGGTLPAFYIDNTLEDTTKPYMLILWDIVLNNRPELGNNKNLKNLLVALLALTKGDVHRSVDIAVPKKYPVTGKIKLATPILDELLKSIPGVNNPFDPDLLFARKIVLGQNMRFGVENALRLTQNAVPLPATATEKERTQKALANSKIRLAERLSYVLEDPHKIATFEFEDHDLEAIISIFGGEQDFSRQIYKSQYRASNFSKENRNPSGGFDPMQSWLNNSNTYANLVTFFQSNDKSPAEKIELFKEILTYAYHQQGRYLDISKLMEHKYLTIQQC